MPSALKHLDALVEMLRLLPKQLTLIDESSERCKHLALFYIRPADLIVNQFLGEMCWSSIPARLPGGATKSEGLARSFWKRVVWTWCVCPGRKKEGVTLSKTLAPAEELQAFSVRFCPLWTCDCIGFFKDKLHIWDVEMQSERCTESSCLDCIIDILWLSVSALLFVCASEGESDF